MNLVRRYAPWTRASATASCGFSPRRRCRRCGRCAGNAGEKHGEKHGGNMGGNLGKLGETCGKPWGKLGETCGKPGANLGKTMGNLWKSMRKIWRTCGKHPGENLMCWVGCILIYFVESFCQFPFHQQTLGNVHSLVHLIHIMRFTEVSVSSWGYTPVDHPC